MSYYSAGQWAISEAKGETWRTRPSISKKPNNREEEGKGEMEEEVPTALDD